MLVVITVIAITAITILMIVAVIVGENGTGLDQELRSDSNGPAAVNEVGSAGVGAHNNGGF